MAATHALRLSATPGTSVLLRSASSENISVCFESLAGPNTVFCPQPPSLAPYPGLEILLTPHPEGLRLSIVYSDSQHIPSTSSSSSSSTSPSTIYNSSSSVMLTSAGGSSSSTSTTIPSPPSPDDLLLSSFDPDSCDPTTHPFFTHYTPHFAMTLPPSLIIDPSSTLLVGATDSSCSSTPVSASTSCSSSSTKASAASTIEGSDSSVSGSPGPSTPDSTVIGSLSGIVDITKAAEGTSEETTTSSSSSSLLYLPGGTPPPASTIKVKTLSSPFLAIDDIVVDEGDEDEELLDQGKGRAQGDVENESISVSPIASLSPTTIATTTTAAANYPSPESDNDLNLHDLHHHHNYLFPCRTPGCSRSFKRDHTRRRHEASHAEILCTFPDCGTRFKRNHDRMRHEYLRHGKAINLCKGCNKTFISKKNLKNHQCSNLLNRG